MSSRARPTSLVISDVTMILVGNAFCRGTLVMNLGSAAWDMLF